MGHAFSGVHVNDFQQPVQNAREHQNMHKSKVVDKQDDGFLSNSFNFDNFGSNGQGQSFFSSSAPMSNDYQSPGPQQTPTQQMSAADAFWPDLNQSFDFTFSHSSSNQGMSMQTGGATTRRGNLYLDDPTLANKTTKKKTATKSTTKVTKTGPTKKGARGKKNTTKPQSSNQIDFDLFNISSFPQNDDLFSSSDQQSSLDPSATVVNGDDSSNLLEDLSFLNMAVDYSDGRKYRDDAIAGDGSVAPMSMMDQFDDLFQSI